MISCASIDTDNREFEISEAAIRKTVEGVMEEAPRMNVIDSGIRSMHYEMMPEAEAMAEAIELNRIVYPGSERVLYYERLNHDDAWDEAYRSLPHDIAWDMAIREMARN